ncbi:MAG: beta strand repeat-containing protein, partial [Ruminococcus sp.]
MKNKKRKKRIASFITAAVMLSGMLPLDYISNINFSGISLPHFSFPQLTADAEDEFTKDANGWVTITTADLFKTYCELYSDENDDTFRKNHQNDTINLILTGGDESRGTFPDDIVGLGTEDKPFGGTILIPDNGNVGEFTITTDAPLFNYVYDSARICTNSGTNALTTFVLKRKTPVSNDSSKPLFANNVVHYEGSTADWTVRLSGDNIYKYAGVIGELGANAKVNLKFENFSNADAANSSDAGIICGKMGSGSSLNLTYTESDAVRTITSVNGNAGGLVGTMEGSAALTINEMPTTSRNITASNGYAGGLVGEMTSESSITVNAGDAIHINSGTVSSALGAGGFCGHYTNKVTAPFDLSHYTINTTAVYGQYCGGVFGVLENNKADSAYPIEYTITGTSAGTLNVNSGSDTTYANTGYFGGVIGKYTTDNLANSLILNNLTVNAVSQTSFNAFGGAIGMVDSAAYIKADNVNITAGGTNMRTTISKSDNCANFAYFGGLVGATAKSNGVLIDLDNFTLSAEDFCGGGVVGQFYNGVLRLSGTTDMTDAKPAGGYDTDNNKTMRFASYGQLVGTNDNVLVYALGNGNDDGWTFKRSIDAVSDDLGTWGEVVRIPNVETDVLTYSDTEHTVTIKSAVSSIGTSADFVTTALNIQLNQGSSYDCLLFEDTNNSKRADLLASTITLTKNINLSGTGVNGFMRDGCVVNASNDNKPVSQITSSAIGDTGAFTGTLNGFNNTVTLAIGESYGQYTDEQTEGTGQIYRHQYNGLFSVVGNGTGTPANIQELTIDGTINVRNAGPNGMFIGGIAARSHGSTTLNDITAKQTVNYYENRHNSNATADLGKNIGGLIGYIDNNSNNGTINITGTTNIIPKFNFSGIYKNWLMYGGAIGNVASSTVTINFAQNSDDVCTVGMTADISGVTANEDSSISGGLIGYIHTNGSYANKKVNINHLEFNRCTVGNPASNTGGGFLGYSWYKTYVTIDGLTVTDGTLECSKNAQNVGVMCYDATGVWKVNSLVINRLTMNNGAGSSLGMIVNKAYNGNNGLYIDVLYSGYTLTEAGITLPATIGIFDEIAAYSAASVINGGNGAGVVSIDMNSTRSGTDVKITDTGTYQNRISSKNDKFANPNSRYYYNLNHIDTTDGGQNLLKWSVSKYAAGNISGEFTTTGNPLGTETGEGTIADLTGLSFYPVPDAGTSTIGNLNLTFDYDIINSTAETTNNTDSYARDPGAENQHYLMQSGLFLNLTEGKTLTIKGNLTLNGNFLSVDKYKGVLISDTMKGSLYCTDGSVLLNGLEPSTAESYLLINNITRDSTTSSPLSMKLSNVSTGEGYTTNDTTPQIAKSLIGAVSGPGLNIEFLKIKLDARTSNNSISGATDEQITALDTAYNTKNSIFTDSTLLDSIKSDDTSVLVYNYTFDEDWGTGAPRNVTYGKEITSSVEYENQEKQYYGDKRYYTNPLTVPDESSGEFDFSTGFLKYVSTDYNTGKENGLYSRELKVNVMTAALNKGCGTYNDPYIITDGKQLEAVSKFINGGNTSDLSKVNLPKKSGDFDSLPKNTTGSRWCSDKTGSGYHAEYVPNSGATGYESTAADSSVWTAVNVQYYLANAYYKINNNIEVSDFLGLGGGSNASTAANTAFRGVIVGEKNENGTLITITNKSDKPFINVSNGCVVKDINIAVDKDIALSQAKKGSSDAAFGYVSKCSYYGGIIGEVMGGDNIIDNCYVTFNDDKKVTLSGDYGMLCPVGSYVGVVVFGAVIFKNMNADKANTNASALNVYYGTDTTNLTAETSKGAIYVNPLVGRVINGYAVHETNQFSVTENGTYHDDEGTSRAGIQHKLKNTTKHYTIADIDTNDFNKLDVSAVPTGTGTTQDGTINIPNSQAFFILSLITQSCAGTSQTATGNYSNSLSYGTYSDSVYGMSRGADYDDIGIDETDSTKVDDYNISVKKYDTATNTAVPYIISRYTNTSNGYTARCVTSTNGYYNINLKNGISYVLPDSFRGIGSVGRMNNTENSTITSLYYTFKLNTFVGKNCDIDIDMYINRYYNRIDNYFDYLHHSTNQLTVRENTNKYTLDFDNDAKYKANGLGLFDTVIMKDKNSAIKEFDLSGSVNVESYKYDNSKPKGEEDKAHHDSDYKKVMWLSVGGICGWSRNDHYVMFEKINLNNLSVRGPCKIAGLLGESGI